MAEQCARETTIEYNVCVNCINKLPVCEYSVCWCLVRNFIQMGEAQMLPRRTYAH